MSKSRPNKPPTFKYVGKDVYVQLRYAIPPVERPVRNGAYVHRIVPYDLELKAVRLPKPLYGTELYIPLDATLVYLQSISEQLIDCHIKRLQRLVQVKEAVTAGSKEPFMPSRA